MPSYQCVFLVQLVYQKRRRCQPPGASPGALLDQSSAIRDEHNAGPILRPPEVPPYHDAASGELCELPRALRNALYTAELCGADVPIYPGSSKPLLRPQRDAVSNRLCRRPTDNRNDHTHECNACQGHRQDAGGR